MRITLTTRNGRGKVEHHVFTSIEEALPICIREFGRRGSTARWVEECLHASPLFFSRAKRLGEARVRVEREVAA